MQLKSFQRGSISNTADEPPRGLSKRFGVVEKLPTRSSTVDEPPKRLDELEELPRDSM
jgi:hypothetical protein